MSGMTRARTQVGRRVVNGAMLALCWLCAVLAMLPFSALAGGVALALIMIPIVLRTTEEMIRLVPGSLREASLALGAPRWPTVVSAVLPVARAGILTGVLLAAARISGETAPLL